MLEVDVKCPKCRAGLRAFERDVVTVDCCDLCYGIWLDKGELQKIISCKDSKPEQSIEKLRDLLSKDTELLEEKDCICPRCNKAMQKIKFATPENVIADKCPHCEGMWFDAGELVSVADFIERIKTEKRSATKDASFSILPSVLFFIFVITISILLVVYIVRLLIK